VQLYAAFAVHGPALLPRIKAELATALRREGFRNATEAVGSGAERWKAARSVCLPSAVAAGSWRHPRTGARHRGSRPTNRG
jgi:hypothetical protein